MDLDTPASSQPSSTEPAPSITVGDRVINWYDDAIVTYGGPSHDDTFTTLTFGMLGGKAPTLACDVERVAPADTAIPAADDRLAIQKRPRSTMPYGMAGPWLLETPLDEAGRVFRSWHRTKRDATAMGLRRLAILDWHAARRRTAASPSA